MTVAAARWRPSLVIDGSRCCPCHPTSTPSRGWLADMLMWGRYIEINEDTSKCPVACTTRAAAELGWYPADPDDESIARRRADAARTNTDRDPATKVGGLTELARQRDVEAAGRAAVADF